MQRRIVLVIMAVALLVCTACRAIPDTDNTSTAPPSYITSSQMNESDTYSVGVTSSNPASSETQTESVVKPEPEPSAPQTEDEIRGVWIAFFELYPMFDGDFSSAFSAMLDKCVDSGFNAVYVHVRSHCDAFYESALFPWSGYCNKNGGVQGVNPGFDPLKIMVNLAHERGLEFHAWINPYRVSKDSTDLSLLADNNPAKIWLTDDIEENDSNVTQWQGSLYLNPAEPEVQKLITDGVREIVAGYGVDGIHFDDYFYPTTDAAFDEMQYAAYRASVTSNPLALADWRRANVNAMVASVYNAVKAERADCIFGISPMASISNNYNTVYADCAKWLEMGIVDYIMPQLYFGFKYSNAKSCFDKLLRDWCELFKGKTQKLYIGLGSYRVGSTAEGFTEWSESPDILSRQIEMLRQDGISDGFVIYSSTTFYKEDELSLAVRESVENTIGNVAGE